MLCFSANASMAQDGPTIAKDSIQVNAFTLNVYKGNFDVWSWVPKIAFRVNGPIASGSQLYVEFSQPTGPWVKFDCETSETQKDRWWKTECGGRDGIPEDKGSTYTGPVNFVIKMRNELTGGGDVTLFTGKAKVGKHHSNEQGPKAVNKFVYYVDHDWALPIGYVFLTADDLKGWERPMLNFAFWVRGDAIKMDPHLFYQGKEVGKIFTDGIEVGKASCEAEVESLLTISVDDSVPQKGKWARVRCTFNNVRGKDVSGEKPGFGEFHVMDKNPGEYEFKLLWNNRLARSIKFTVEPGGKFENGISPANKLGSPRPIFAVQIIGEQDGQWDRNAWKTDAFYGNPLTGFTPVP